MKVLVLAGGYDQIRLIQEYKKRGYTTILVDYYEAPPAKEFADKHYQESTLDVDAVKQIAINEKVDLISTACTDQALVSMAQISEELGLPCYLTYNKALEVTNKKWMKQKMVQKGIPTSSYSVINKVEDLDWSVLKFPLVVKPSDANSSKGVIKVTRLEEVGDAIKIARTYSREEKVIVEEFKNGIEISVDAWIVDNRAKMLCVSQSVKMQENESNFTIIQSQYPYELSKEHVEELERITESIAEEFELNNCPMLIQLIHNEEGFFVIEFSARMGGGTKYELIKQSSGVDVMEAFVDLSLGIKPVLDVVKSNKYIHMNYNYCFAGTIHKFIGFDEMKEQGVIDKYFYYKTPGMIIEKANNSSDRSSGYLVSSDDLDDLCEKEKLVESRICVLDDSGTDIRRRLL